MHTAIGLTLLFASATAALGLNRVVGPYLVRSTWITLLPLLTQSGMMIWFLFAAGWVLLHG